MKIRALAATLAVVAAIPAAAQEGLIWLAGEDPAARVLLYGLPESDHVVIAFRCTADFDGVSVIYNHEAQTARPGMIVAIDLSSEGGARLIKARAVFSEMTGGYFLEATAKPEALESVLSTGPTLFVMVGDGVEELPMPDHEMVRDFFAGCARFT